MPIAPAFQYAQKCCPFPPVPQQVVAAAGLDVSVRQAAAVNFKNLVKRRWVSTCVALADECHAVCHASVSDACWNVAAAHHDYVMCMTRRVANGVLRDFKLKLAAARSCLLA